MQVHYDEGIANHIGPEPCAGIREDVGEASAGERAGQPYYATNCSWCGHRRSLGFEIFSTLTFEPGALLISIAMPDTRQYSSLINRPRQPKALVE